MTSPVDPVRGVPLERRVKERREAERRQARVEAEAKAAIEPQANLPVPAAPPPPEVSLDQGAAAALAAQLLGQGGQKRGLRGGPPVLQGARAAYLEAEWSGPNDRRKPTGRIAKTQA